MAISKTSEFSSLVLEVLRNQQGTLDRLDQAIHGGDSPGLKEAMATSLNKIENLEKSVDAQHSKLANADTAIADSQHAHDILDRLVMSIQKEQTDSKKRKIEWFDEVVRGIILVIITAAVTYALRP